MPWRALQEVALQIVTTVDSVAFTTEYDKFFRKYSEKHFGASFDWRWFKAQGIAESMLAPLAQSWCGAKGIMQIMPGTFKDIKRENSWIKSIDDPEQNIAAGVFYDQKLYQMWSGPRSEIDRIAFMLGAYNAGAGNILKAQKLCKFDPNLWASIASVAKQVDGWKSAETIGYVSKIMQLMSVQKYERRKIS